MQDETDRLIEDLVEKAPALRDLEISSLPMRAFMVDIAQDIYPKDAIAKRYNLTLAEMLMILQLPGVIARVREMRAVWQSGLNTNERTKAYFSLVAMEAAPVFDKILHDPNVGVRDKIDALKQAGLISGLTAPAPRDGVGAPGAPGNQFGVNIIFSSGAQERITTVVDPPTPVELPTITLDGSTE